MVPMQAKASKTRSEASASIHNGCVTAAHEHDRPPIDPSKKKNA
tara:strand:+ start:1119 stop:1250 length:132 start_codon:yes stop_codon:yes gene_type:complete